MILEEEGPDVTTDSILRELGIDPDVERAMNRIFAASSPSRNVNEETVSRDYVGINQDNPDTFAVLNNAENTQEGSVAGHNASESATRSVFATDDNTAGAVLNGIWTRCRVTPVARCTVISVRCKFKLSFARNSRSIFDV